MIKPIIESYGEEEALDDQQRAHLRLASHCLSRALRDLFSQDQDTRRHARKWLLGTYDFYPDDEGLRASFLCECLDIPYLKLKHLIIYQPKKIRKHLRGFEEKFIRLRNR
jgi:hypothetical protein